MTRKSWPFLSTYQERSPIQHASPPSEEASRVSIGQGAITFGIDGMRVVASPLSAAQLRCSDFTGSDFSPAGA
ncbi:hypothetical protein [Acidovorax sp. NCPPB 3576]|uniref:hypothetical protein n=1 Tax=Acidovorax sp. NCPPB 3576 TaxID=2940488 RepID=UPI00234A5ECA|nr:hypothetical protein [Acidovorax sp. NCPPB 3576]WCM86481.1 hypothetical protein M5C98_13910 [Acidovorax sp. NCPPB 3576]